MFSKYITQTPLTHRPAADVLARISAVDYGGDFSLTATLRALLWNRTEDNVSARISSVPVRTNRTKESVLNSIENVMDLNSDSLIICHIYGLDADCDFAISAIEDGLEARREGWKRLDKVKAFFKNAMNTTCFVNVEDKRTVLFVKELNVQKLHYLQCGILAYMPWYFKPEDGITSLERELIESLRKKTATEYERCIQKFYESLDIRDAMIRTKLNGFERKFERERIRDLESSINNLYNTIQRYESDLRNYMQERYEKDSELRALEEKLASGSDDNEIMNYFLRNRSVHLMQTRGMEMTFVVNTDLAYFDEDTAETYINNPNSFMYKYADFSNYSDSQISHEQMKKLLTAIFIDQAIKIKVCAAYTFDSRCTVSGRQMYPYGDVFKDVMKNPHINYFACIGDYRPMIDDALGRRDYVSAIEQCSASARSLAFTDTTVMKKFMLEMYGLDGNNGKFIELPDGTRCTTVEAVKWIEEQEAANE